MKAEEDANATSKYAMLFKKPEKIRQTTFLSLKKTKTCLKKKENHEFWIKQKEIGHTLLPRSSRNLFYWKKTNGND